jgi:hypothetical protein
VGLARARRLAGRIRAALGRRVLRGSPWLRPHARAILRRLHLESAVLRSAGARRLLLGETDPRYRAILATRPCRIPAGDGLELHLLTCEPDVLRTVWALKSFYRFSSLAPRLVLHDDGTLSDRSRATLAAHFPRCEQPRDGAARVAERLARHPMCRFFYGKHVIARKLFDVLLLARADYLIVMDTDVLWFRESPQISGCVRARTPFHLSGASEAYARNRTFMEEHCGLVPARNLNSGLLGFRRHDLLDLDFIDAALDRLVHVPPSLVAASLGYRHPGNDPGFDPRDPVNSVVWWVMEQTIYALLLQRCADRVPLARVAEGGRAAHRFAGDPITPGTAVQHFISDRSLNAFFPLGVEHLLRTGFLEAWAPEPPPAEAAQQ